MLRSLILPLLLAAAQILPAPAAPFLIEIVDRETGRGVPLVELKTVHHLRYLSDSNGLVAFDEPGLMDRDVYFHVRSHGYTYPEDGFGYRGKRLRTTPGAAAKLEIDRTNIAERLYRVTGAGIYADSVRGGRATPLAQPLLNAEVLGSDSVLNALFNDRLFWIWGDTNRLRYPLGNFQVSAATSLLPGRGGLDPSRGVDLEYFTREDGFVRGAAPLPGKGPTWLSALTVLEDSAGAEHLGATYMKVRPPMEVYERGLCEWDPEKKEFHKLFALPEAADPAPHGHPFPMETDGRMWLYYGSPFPNLRVPAAWEAWQDPVAWEEVKSTVTLRDRPSGDPVKAHRGSITWNPWLAKWLAIFVETGGASNLGEVWCAAAEHPEGPWTDCTKILTHDRYSFYNPKQHPYFAKENGRIVYFEGTYAATFSGNPVRTSRYDYNQVMYRLDLADPRLNFQN